MNDAVHEYQKNTDLLETTDHVYFTGPMQCFCKVERSNGKSVNEEYTVYNKQTGDEVFSGPICKAYFGDILKSKILGQSIAFIVVFMNVIIKQTVRYLVTYIGEETASEQKRSVTRGVFLG